MNGGRSADPAAAYRALRLMTWILPFVLWVMGFLSSRFLMGCDTPLALTKATAYAISWMAGWAVYLQINRRADPQTYVWSAPGLMANSSLLNPTRTPWPFLPMLAFGIVVSVSLAVILSLMNRLMVRVMKGLRPGND